MNKYIKLFLILITVFSAVSTDCFAFNCNDHAYRDCIGDNVFWYDSCSNVEDLYQNCGDYNLTCQYGQCVYKKEAKFTAHYQKACYKDNIFWYDSLGNINDFYQGCADSNSCTLDNCKSSECRNVLMCDGSTCAAGSNDYKNYCKTSSCGNGKCEDDLGETKETCLDDCKIEKEDNNNQAIQGTSISFFVKKDVNSQQWDKSVQMGQNGTAYFMITLNNDSESQIDNVIVSVNIPSEISYLGNLNIDNVALSGDIVAGVDIGSVQAMSKKTITFEGKTQNFNIQEKKEAVAFINSIEPHQSDSVYVNFDNNQPNSAAISSVPMSQLIWEFIKRWFMWIITGIVMIVLFVTIFRRISSNV
jgi:hypothetical protein